MAIRNGNNRSNFLFGTFGSDEINGRGGNDIMFGLFGNDTMRGGNGNDLMFGGGGNDRVFGGNGNDIGFGGSGDDRLVGGRGSDLMFGGSGNDTFVYRADRNVGEQDFYAGGSGNDRLVIRLTADEAADANIQADIEAFETFIAEGGRGNFTFESLGLTVNSIERLRVIAPDPEPVENVAPVVSGPVALADATEDEGFFISTDDLLDGATDADGDDLTISVPTAANGSLTATEGGYLYQGAANYNGADTLSYSISDGEGNSVSQTAALFVAAVNDDPVVIGPVDLGSVDEDGFRGILPSQLLDGASDVDSETLSVEDLMVTSGNATLVSGDFGFEVRPDDDVNGTIEFSYTIVDGDNGSVVQTATMAITEENDAPTAGAPIDLGAVDEGDSILFSTSDLLANAMDVDGDSLEARELIATGGVLTDLGDGDFEFTADQVNPGGGSATISFQITDGLEPVTGQASVTVNDVPPVNSAPVVNGIANLGSSLEDNTATLTTALLTSTAADADGDALFATNLTVRDNAGTLDGLTFTPFENFNGPVTFDYEVSDGEASTAAVAELQITPVNDAPTSLGQLDLGSIEEDTELTITFAQLVNSVRDVDGDALSIPNAVVTSDNGDIVASGPDFVFTPDDDVNGTATFNFTVSDGPETVQQSATLEITPVNDAPVANDDSFTVGEDETLPILLSDLLDNDTDVDGDVLSVVSDDQSDLFGMLTENEAGYVFAPAEDAQTLAEGDELTTTFDYTVVDADGVESTAEAEITIIGANDAPEAEDDGQTVADLNGEPFTLGLRDDDFNDVEVGETLELDVLANDTDVDNSAVLEITGVTLSDELASRVSVSIDGAVGEQTLQFTANQDFFDFIIIDEEPGPRDDLPFPDGPFDPLEPIFLPEEEISFQYTISDQEGGEDTATVNVFVYEGFPDEAF